MSERALLTQTDSSVATLADVPADAMWIEAIMPGGVHESLLAAGQIPHPFLDEHEDDVRWIEHRTWWYRVALDGSASAAPGQRVRLVLPSVDTVATVWFNDVLVGTHANAFRPFVADVTALVRLENDLVVRIAPPLEGLDRPAEPQQTLDVLAAYAGDAVAKQAVLEPPVGLLQFDSRLTRRRKPTYSWGWDFGPSMPSVGLLAPPQLVTEQAAALVGTHVRLAGIEGTTAQVAIDIEVDAFAASSPLRADAVLTSPSGVVTTASIDVTSGRGAAVLGVPEAELWWTHDLGAPALYDATIELRDETGVLDTSAFRVGLRTISIDRPVDVEEGGRRFCFLLNGVPLFARGANWVPPSTLRGSITPERVRGLIQLAHDGGQNMLRIWGGGHYEQDAFYEACDELGVLVWQDFMFACFDYPSADAELQQEVALEAAYQVTRLRNHPSIAVWCGNNEIETLHEALRQTLAPGDWGWHFFHSILPDAVARYSPGTAYWPGSPWGENDPKGVNGPVDGDRHYWDVWHGKDGAPDDMSRGEAMHWKWYADDLTKFGSEFGIQSFPQFDTLQRWLSDPLELNDQNFKRRVKDVPKTKGRNLIEYEIGEVATIDEYIDASMACQAEGLKFGIEHYRRRQPHCNGTLVWQFNDVWPGVSWSVIDYDLVPKAGYYFLQRAFRNVIASFVRTDAGVELWVSNSGRDDATLDLSVRITGFDGSSHVDDALAYVAPARSSAPVWSSAEVAVDRFAWVSDASGGIPANRLFFGQLKELPLGHGKLLSDIVDHGDGRASVRLRSEGYSYFSRVVADCAGVRFSGNYLDLRDGDEATIEVAGLPSRDVLRVESWGQR